MHDPEEGVTSLYEVVLRRDIVERDWQLTYLLVIIWKAVGNASKETMIWFKTSTIHELTQGKSVIHLCSEIPQLNGYFLVNQVSREQGNVEGRTLFALSARENGLLDVAADSRGIIWTKAHSLDLLRCSCLYELGNTTGQYEITHTYNQSTSDLHALESEIEVLDLQDTIVNTSEAPTVQEGAAHWTSAVAHPQYRFSSRATSVDTFAGFNIPSAEGSTEANTEFLFRKSNEGDPFWNVSGPNTRITESMKNETMPASSVLSENGSHRVVSPTLTEACESDETDWTPFVLPTDDPVIISDPESEMNEVEEELLEEVPFPVEEFGLKPLDYKLVDQGLIVSKFFALVHDTLMEIRYTVRLILFDDLKGSKFHKIFAEEIREALPQAIMQRGTRHKIYAFEIVLNTGSHACLVPQKLFGAIRRAMHKLDVAYLHYGGVLLNVLCGLENASSKKQFDLDTNVIEPSARSPFEHITQTEENSLRSLTRTLTCSHSTSAGMPNYEWAIDAPSFGTSIDDRIGAMFRCENSSVSNELWNLKFMKGLKDDTNESVSNPLRKYQEICIEKFMSRENLVFVAPTGAGKTKIFVECSRELLMRNRDAAILVLCPTVPLATQQARIFVRERFLDQGFKVDTFSSNNRLDPKAWKSVIRDNNVVVLTPQVLLNVMEYYKDVFGFSVFSAVSLLVLDECHHTQKNHPYNKIIEGLMNDKNTNTQVIGFSASPINCLTIDEGYKNLKTLLDQLNAQCIVIPCSNLEVQTHVPVAKEETIYVDQREDDLEYILSLSQFMLNASMQYIEPYVRSVEGLCTIPNGFREEIDPVKFSAAFDKWSKASMKNLRSRAIQDDPVLVDLVHSIELLSICNASIDLVNNIGFEVALRFVSIHVSSISKVMQLNIDTIDWMYPHLLSGLYSIKAIQSIDPVLQTFGMNPFANGHCEYPRFVQLVRILERYKDNDHLHGIIFIKSRDAVYHICELLRNISSLRDITFLEFTGHGTNSKRPSKNMAPFHFQETCRGMTNSTQQEILKYFSSPGKYILCATSAAEEGINIISCHLVIRYSVTYTGIQRIQSRGRSRVKGGMFYNIIQIKSKEMEYLRKSQQQERNMDIALHETDEVEHL